MDHLNAKAFGRFLYFVVTFSALIFLPAWTLDYWQAWVFLGVFTVSISAIFIYLAKNDRTLLARRVNTTEKGRDQTIIRFLIKLAVTAVIVLSAVDHRFGWSAVSLYAVLAGDGLVALGLLIIFRVFQENTFTAATIQVEAGQKVISTGPYALVRHPMYAGGLVIILGIPLALGSWWGLLMIGLFTAVIAWRILDEEKVLAKDLPGYLEYRDKVRYRLVAFVW